MGLMDMFKPSAPAAAAPAQQQQQANPAVQQPGGVTVPTTPQTPPGQMEGSKQEPVNPMDAYAKLFDNSATPNAPPSFNIDPKVLGEAASGMNFTQGIPQELMSKATGGDANALIEMMNLVGQQAYRQSLSHSSALTDRFVGLRSEFDLKGIDSKVTQKLTASALADSPNYSHPVVKQEFARIANAFQTQNPDSSPAEIAKATKDYMQNLHDAMNPATKTKEQQQASEVTDWDKYMTS